MSENDDPAAEWNSVGETNDPAPTVDPAAFPSLSLGPTPEARARDVAERARWLRVDTERMTGVVPHLAQEGNLSARDPAILVNEQVTSCPFYDPADGIWGGVDLGAMVAYYPPGSATWWPAVVVELFTDASARVHATTRDGAETRLVPHQSNRRPGGACWAHRTEQFTITGRMAAELQLGVGGSAYEEERELKAAELVADVLKETNQ